MFETFSEKRQIEKEISKVPDSKAEIRKEYLEANIYEIAEKELLLDAPRQISRKSYSLGPDMATGWRPKRSTARVNYHNVFPINFSNDVVDQIVRSMRPRWLNSYSIHQKRSYNNPYPASKKIESSMPERPGLNKIIPLKKSGIVFDSDFESGNLDVAIKISDSEYDLFIRVDSNTKGHTNWFNFTVANKDWMGPIKFNICNFRREKSLYQRGMRPYIKSQKEGGDWKQSGYDVLYEKKNLRYKFLFDPEEEHYSSLQTYFTMSFTYDFTAAQDNVQCAYFIPYTYSQLLSLICQVSCCPLVKYQTAWRSLSGLPVPVLQITDADEPSYNKTVVLVTARIHPGESNSSYVCEGFIKQLCSADSKQMLKRFIFCIVPMLNPDGVVAGNYRTSFFGKDLNRTFSQSRKYAFPETYHLMEYAKNLKKEHKQRFTTYIDLHGHSAKKNIFFYGPDFNISHNYYSHSRDFARILGNLTAMFRYYSCVFRISSEKVTTARATFNRSLNIPFTYTMESSNGAFYNSIEHREIAFTSTHLTSMGITLVKGLNIWNQGQKDAMTKQIKKINFVIQSDDEAKDEDQNEKLKFQEPPGKQKQSDDQISEGGSDSEPEDEDFSEVELLKLESDIQGKVQQVPPCEKKEQSPRNYSPEKSERPQKPIYDWSLNLRQSQSIKNSALNSSRKQRLPPINMQVNQIQFLGRHSKKKKLAVAQAASSNHRSDEKSSRLSISQMLLEAKQSVKLPKQELELVLEKRPSRLDMMDRKRQL